MADYATARRNMVDCQVRPSDVTDGALIEAMLDVPRETFLPMQLQPLAYLDLDLNVASAGQPPRNLIRPALLAQMLQAADIAATDTVLVVGCATGYAAAVVAKLAGRVVATEPDGALAQAATAALATYGNVRVMQAQPADGETSGAPYDVIVVNGASQVGMSALQSQLTDGGRLVVVSASGPSERAVIVTRSGDDFGDRVLCDATAPVLPGLERHASFVF